jgi:NADH-quinone oxidoreductase subunit K
VSVGPAHYLVLSGILFAIGLFGVIARRNMLASLASLSILFSAPIIGAVGVAEAGNGVIPHIGDAFALVMVAALCSQLVLGGAVIALVWRRAETIDMDELSELDD